MVDSNKVSFRLSPALQAALAAHVRQHGGQVSDILREALEAYLGLRPTGSPTSLPQVSDSARLSDSLSDMSATIQALVSDVARLQAHVDRLDAFLTTRPPRVRQRPTPPQPEQPEAADPAPRGQRKLTPRQIRALRDKHRRGVPVPALMDEYGLSRASVFRYLQSDKRASQG